MMIMSSLCLSLSLSLFPFSPFSFHQLLSSETFPFFVLSLSLFILYRLSSYNPYKSPTSPSLNERIRDFYDSTTALWVSVWSPHLSHGFYGPQGTEALSDIDAQRRLVREILRVGEFKGVYERAVRDRGLCRVLDVGCGVGGASLLIASAYPHAHCVGITLSPVQQRIALQLAKDRGLEDRCSVHVGDALHLPYKQGEFDFVYSCESGEHMQDKGIFVGEMRRVLREGGRIGMVTWCIREEGEGEGGQGKGPLSSMEKGLLSLLCRNYCLPRWVSGSIYTRAMGQQGLREVGTEDWTQAIGPFWWRVLSSALHPKALYLILTTGPIAMKGLLTAFLMILGFKIKLLKFLAFTAKK